MKRLSLYTVLLALPLLVAAGASAPQFKNPAVRDAHAKYEAAKRGYEIALKRGIALAKRQGDEGEVETMQAHLDALTGVTDEVVPQSVRDFARSIAGARYQVASGVITFGTDGSLSHSHSSWRGRTGSWKTIGSNDIEIQTFDGRRWRAAFTVDRKYLMLVLEPGRQPEAGALLQ